MVSDWSCHFHFGNRRPNVLLTLPSSGVVGSHMPYHPYRLVGFPIIRIVHRTFCPSRPRERIILRNFYLWLLVLDLAPAQQRTIYDRFPPHAHLGYILPRSLLVRIFPTTRQHQRLGMQNHLPSAARHQDWQDE
jgi:hypothetical protein